MRSHASPRPPPRPPALCSTDDESHDGPTVFTGTAGQGLERVWGGLEPHPEVHGFRVLALS
ncbi:hypothetical protein [Kitasatospora sp. NPDC008115]|uniref:hypothetical protein n=1 Tax=Kitasatospora sp. NPDC008115 TaxID=3364022 RepID=UPI0036E1F70D